jgi:hypothetical protein
MTSLMGECFGVVKNSVSATADDRNCYWKSGDQNYKLAVVSNDQVILCKETGILQKTMKMKLIIVISSLLIPIRLKNMEVGAYHVSFLKLH